MNKSNRHIKIVDDTLNDINQGVQTLVETSEQAGEKLGGITEELVKGNRYICGCGNRNSSRWNYSKRNCGDRSYPIVRTFHF